jgi:hypothetical protein
MKTILSTVLFLMITSAAFAVNFEGNWATKVKVQDGTDMELTFVFKMEGEKLTGVIKTPNGDMAISNPNVIDKVLTFDVTFGDMTIKHVCTLKDDDTISAKVEGSPMGDSEMILKRQK